MGIVEPVDDTQSLRDCILGTDIHSTAHTVGQTSVELQPDPDRGLLDTLFFGTTHSDNIGYHGPVTIYSSATTRPSLQTPVDRGNPAVGVPGRVQCRDRGADLRHPVEQGPPPSGTDGLGNGAGQQGEL